MAAFTSIALGLALGAAAGGTAATIAAKKRAANQQNQQALAAPGPADVGTGDSATPAPIDANRAASDNTLAARMAGQLRKRRAVGMVGSKPGVSGQQAAVQPRLVSRSLLGY